MNQRPTATAAVKIRLVRPGIWQSLDTEMVWYMLDSVLTALEAPNLPEQRDAYIDAHFSKLSGHTEKLDIIVIPDDPRETTYRATILRSAKDEPLGVICRWKWEGSIPLAEFRKSGVDILMPAVLGESLFLTPHPLLPPAKPVVSRALAPRQPGKK